jgi:hypothetical protein
MRRIKEWLTSERYLMISAGTLFFAIAVTLLAITFNTAWAKNWDVLSFSGSIIGGIITLVGVRWTLKNQYRTEFLQQYPERKKSIDEVYGRLNSFVIFLESCIKIQSYGQVAESCYHLLSDSEELISKSVHSAYRVYSSTNAFLAEVRALFDYMGNPLDDHNKKTELATSCLFNMVFNLTIIEQVRAGIDKHFTKIEDPNHF